MNRFCTHCGTALSQEARFCGRCGRPAETLPAAAPPHKSLPQVPPRRPARRRGPLMVGLGMVGICLCLATVAGLIFWVGDGVVPDLPFETAAVEADVDPEILQTLEESVTQIEAAFRAGDVETVLSLTHPAMRADYQAMFQAHQAELSRVADLLATRQLVQATASMAEYEVTENGRTFSVIFEAWGDQWYLSSL